MASQEIVLMAHLMRRAGFGARRDELERRAAVGYEETVEELLSPEEYGIPPTDTDILFRTQHFLEAGNDPPGAQSVTCTT